jgi:hypothetical protein
MVPGGAPSFNSGFILFLLKIIIGGRNMPPADIHITAVDDCPRSAEVTRPTCLRPFFAKVFELRPGTVDNEVSSTLYIL